MTHERILRLDDAALVVIDVQEAFRNYIFDFEPMVKNISNLILASQQLGVPMIWTEQYPRGLGSTVTELQRLMAGSQQFEKSCFSCVQHEPFNTALARLQRRQIIVAGIEAHVCVNQTVHDLLESEYQVHLVVDAAGSRSPVNKEIAVDKMSSSGAVLTTVEMAVFEMLQRSGTEIFKSVQKLFK